MSYKEDMNKVRRRVLGLGRETLARLGDAELAVVGGGSDAGATQTVQSSATRAPQCPVKITEQPTCVVVSG